MSDSRPEGVVARKPMAKAMAPNAASAMTFFVMAVATLYFGKDVLMPVTLAMLFAFVGRNGSAEWGQIGRST
jgi:predicted PurR-regulated permease PerM